MKIILSRKGFDSEYGKQPSPIFPNGTMLSLPIYAEPPDESTVTYNDLSYSSTESIGDVLSYLKARKAKKAGNARILPNGFGPSRS